MPRPDPRSSSPCGGVRVAPESGVRASVRAKIPLPLAAFRGGAHPKELDCTTRTSVSDPAASDMLYDIDARGLMMFGHTTVHPDESSYGQAAPALTIASVPEQVQASSYPYGGFDRSLAILRLLLAEAENALDRDPGRARSALSRAVAVIEADAAEHGHPTHGKGLAPWQVKKVATYIQQELEQSIRVEELAEIARLSCSHFSRAFRENFGCTPQKFIVDQRVTRARQLMITTDMQLCDIALACGFSDQAHLTRVFRARTGSTPGAWRRARESQ